MYEKAIEALNKCFHNLGIVRVPNDNWDGKTEFDKGIARVAKPGGFRYAIVRFNKIVSDTPYVIYDPDIIAGAITSIVTETIKVLPKNGDYFELQRELIEKENVELYANTQEAISGHENKPYIPWADRLSQITVKASEIEDMGVFDEEEEIQDDEIKQPTPIKERKQRVPREDRPKRVRKTRQPRSKSLK